MKRTASQAEIDAAGEKIRALRGKRSLQYRLYYDYLHWLVDATATSFADLGTSETELLRCAMLCSRHVQIWAFTFGKAGGSFSPYMVELGLYHDFKRRRAALLMDRRVRFREGLTPSERPLRLAFAA